MTTYPPTSLQEWRAHAQAVQSNGKWCYDALWLPLAPFFETHGYTLWVRADMKMPPTPGSLIRLAPPNSNPRVFDGYTYLSPYLPDGGQGALAMRPRMQPMSPVICPARTAQNHDVIIRLVAVGSFGDQHSRALDRAAGFAALPENHAVPVLERIVYANQYHFAVFPKMQDVVSLPDFHAYAEAADYIEQLVEGLDFFHGQSISHGDICKENILVNLSGPHFAKEGQPLRSLFPTRYYYTDLELATCSDVHGEIQVQGTPFSWGDRAGIYGRPSAAEVFKPGLYCPFRADIWQLGHLLHEEFEEVLHFEGYQSLFRDMMEHDPSLRPLSKEVLQEVRRLKQGLPQRLQNAGVGSIVEETVSCSIDHDDAVVSEGTGKLVQIY